MKYYIIFGYWVYLKWFPWFSITIIKDFTTIFAFSLEDFVCGPSKCTDADIGPVEIINTSSGEFHFQPRSRTFSRPRINRIVKSSTGYGLVHVKLKDPDKVIDFTFVQDYVTADSPIQALEKMLNIIHLAKKAADY